MDGGSAYSGGFTTNSYGSKKRTSNFSFPLPSGGIESRPYNFTTKIWKRIN